MQVISQIHTLVKFYFYPQYWRESWVKIIRKDLQVLGAVWLIISLIDFFFRDLNVIPQAPQLFWYVFIFSVLFSIITVKPPLEFSETIKGKDISIRVVVGDLFSQNGDVVIPTNSTFDTTFSNDFISPLSIQGQLSKKEYDKIEYLDQEIEKQLRNIKPKKILKRKSSKNKQYDIGTIIKLTHRSGFRSYWVALADVNEHGKPDGKFENLQVCLESLWQYINTKGHMTKLIIPIMGSGKTGINEKRITILKEIIFSFVASSKEKKVTEELVICLYPDDVIKGKIDIYYLRKYLDYQCNFRYESTVHKSTSTEMS